MRRRMPRADRRRSPRIDTAGSSRALVCFAVGWKSGQRFRLVDTAGDGAGGGICGQGAQMHHSVQRLHAEFHKCAARVLTHAVSNESEQASDLMSGSFDERSQRLLIALAKWKRELFLEEAA